MSGLLSGLVQSIINRYLQKWLKNVTTEHATIWGGEMVFKNVELRLDVLQEELGLPLVFTRGFIQELRVYVPLASLLRESIKFTLTNLEVVASTPAETGVRTRKKEAKDASVGRPSPTHGPASQRVRHLSDDTDKQEKQPGWIQSVLQRVLQNIGVEIRNLVFKYSTESYVSSVSWKSLSLSSTNSEWVPGFANPEGETCAVFKALSVADITWCLDAVDFDGKTSYQTPLFNRESVMIRAILRSAPEGDTSQHEPYQLPAVQVDVKVPHVLLTVSERQVTMLSLFVSELALMARDIVNAKRDGRAAPDKDRARSRDAAGKDGVRSASPAASPALLHVPGEDGGSGDAGGGGVRGSDEALLPIDLGAAAGLEGDDMEEGRRGGGSNGERGGFAFLWGEEGEEEEEEMEEEEEERIGSSLERRKLASTSIVASLSVPWVGFVYVSSRCPASSSSPSPPAPSATQKGSGGTLDVAGTGITVLFRQMKIDGPVDNDEGQGQLDACHERAYGDDHGGAAGGKSFKGLGRAESSTGSARDRERERERERDRERERERLVVRDVRACVVGLSAHVHPVGADAETVFSFGGPVSSVCGKRRMELSRGHLANVVPDGKGSAGGAGEEGIWAGMPEPRSFTGALSLFEHVRLMRNNSKGWLSRGDQSYEPMSEGERGSAVERIFTSPLPYALGADEMGSAAQQQQGGLLMDALMARDADTVVASLLRRAQGEQVPLAVPEQPKFDDGWAHDDSVAILVSLSVQQRAPPADKDRLEKIEKFSLPAGPGRQGMGATTGGLADGEQGCERQGDCSKKDDALWIKTHVQPLRVRLSNSAMHCCNALLSSALHAKRPSPAPRFRTPQQTPVSAPSSPPSLAPSYSPGAVPVSSQAAKTARQQHVAQEPPRLLVSLDFMLAGVDVVYFVEEALRTLDGSQAAPFHDPHLQEALLRAGTVGSVSSGMGWGRGSGGVGGASSWPRPAIPCAILSVGPCCLRNCIARQPKRESRRTASAGLEVGGGVGQAGVQGVHGVHATGDSTRQGVGSGERGASCGDAACEVLREYRGQVSSVQLFLSTVQAGTHTLGSMRPLLQTPAQLALEAHHRLQRGGGGEGVCWHGSAECAGTTAVLHPRDIALLDLMLQSTRLAAARKQAPGSFQCGGGGGIEDGARHGDGLDEVLGGVADSDEPLEIIFGPYSAVSKADCTGLFVQGRVTSLEMRGLGLDISWNGDRQAGYTHAAGPGWAAQATAAHDRGYALICEFQSSTSKHDDGDRGKEGGQNAPVGMQSADELREVQSGGGGGLLRSIALLGARKSCTRLWLGGGALQYSAMGTLPLVRALIACRRRAGVRPRGGDSAGADTGVGTACVGGAEGAVRKAGASGQRGSSAAGTQSLVPPSSTSSDDSFFSSQFSSGHAQQVQAQDTRMHPQMPPQHDVGSMGGVPHGGGGQHGNDAEYAAATIRQLQAHKGWLQSRVTQLEALLAGQSYARPRATQYDHQTSENEGTSPPPSPRPDAYYGWTAAGAALGHGEVRLRPNLSGSVVMGGASNGAGGGDVHVDVPPLLQHQYSQRAGMLCDTCQRPYTPTACERLLAEATGMRKAVLRLARSMSSSSSKVVIRRDLSFRRPWPVVLALFGYAAVLHLVIAYLLHQAGPSFVPSSHFWR